MKICIQAIRVVNFTISLSNLGFTMKTLKLGRNPPCRRTPKKNLRYQIEVDNNPCWLVRVSFSFFFYWLWTSLSSYFFIIKKTKRNIEILKIKEKHLISATSLIWKCNILVIQWVKDYLSEVLVTYISQLGGKLLIGNYINQNQTKMVLVLFLRCKSIQ